MIRTLLVIATLTMFAQSKGLEPDANLVSKVKDSLSDITGTLSSPCSNRTVWDAIKTKYGSEYTNINTTMIPFNDSAYLEFRAGNRIIAETMMKSRMNTVTKMVLAECMNWNGSYLAPLETALVDLATQKSWSSPAHDPNLTYFNQQHYFIELESSNIAALLGQTLSLIGDKLTKETQQIILNSLSTRIFNPLRGSLNGSQPFQWWITGKSNWNSDCWASIVIAANTALQSKDERAYFTAAAFQLGTNYLDSFAEDGYGKEGVYYYNYGFGSFIVLREAMYQATRGAFDMFAIDKAAKSALFSDGFNMARGVAASFADSPLLDNFNPSNYEYVALSFGISRYGHGQKLKWSFGNTLGGQLLAMMIEINPTSLVKAVSVNTVGLYSLRKYYQQSGVLVTRTNTDGNDNGLSATFKLGGNGGHSHNDFGSYQISIKGVKLTGDPGGPLFYDANTFNSNRYNSKLMNSHGHPVPIIDGGLQVQADLLWNSPHSSLKPKVLRTEFSDSMDTIAFDLTKAYTSPKLVNLTRTMVFNREEQTILVSDSVAYNTPSAFEDALISNYGWEFDRFINSTGYICKDGLKMAVFVEADTPWIWKCELLSEYNVTFHRIAIQPTGLVQNVQVNVTFTLVDE